MFTKQFKKIENWGLMLLAFFSQSAWASNETGLPWESPIATISESLSGPVAYGIATIALVACFAGLTWGGEMGDTMKRTVNVSFAIAGLLLANAIINTLFGVTGAMVGV